MNAEYPLISVIIPAYNSGGTIERAVNSVLSQTYANWEAVVVDDGSYDNTAAIIREKYAGDSRIRLITKNNQGVSAARNDGIRAAAGSWFVTLDADDYIAPGMLLSMYNAARQSAADLVICGFRTVYEKSGRKRVYRVSDEYADDLGGFMEDMFLELYDKRMISTHSNKLYSMELVRKRHILYNGRLKVNEDIDFVLRYLAVCSAVCVIPAVHLSYVQHGAGESLINTFRENGVAGAVLVMKDALELAAEAKVPPRAEKGIERRMFVHICAFAGLMYRYSGYSEERKLCEIETLASQKDFKALLRDLRPGGIKDALACFLLKHGFCGAYHKICMIFYGGGNFARGEGTVEPPEGRGADAAGGFKAEELSTACLMPYRMLGLAEAPGTGEETEPVVTRRDMERLAMILKARGTGDGNAEKPKN